MIDLAALRQMARGPVTDVACPECGPSRKSPVNRLRKVLRIWDRGSLITYRCARCQISGFATDRGSGQTFQQVEQRQHTLDPRRISLARLLWKRSLPLKGSLAETYLRSRSCFIDSPSLRFLPPRHGRHPSMIARFAGDDSPTSVHLTRLASNGVGKAGTDKDKIILGRSLGDPIIIHRNDDREEIVITEGIEDAASIALATGWTTFAAGSGVRIPPIVSEIDGSCHKLYLAVDDDEPSPNLPLGEGMTRLMQVLAIFPGVIPLHFSRVAGKRDRVDANKTLQRFGSDGILGVIDWCEAKYLFSRGEIGVERMMQMVDRANNFFHHASLVDP